jgi:hypothetical protein
MDAKEEPRRESSAGLFCIEGGVDIQPEEKRAPKREIADRSPYFGRETEG